MGGHGCAHVMLWVGMSGHRSLLMGMVWVWVQLERKMLGSDKLPPQAHGVLYNLPPGHVIYKHNVGYKFFLLKACSPKVAKKPPMSMPFKTSKHGNFLTISSCIQSRMSKGIRTLHMDNAETISDGALPKVCMLLCNM